VVGGTNVVVLDISNGMLPDLYDESLLKAFAGVHFISTAMPTAGDTAMTPLRGAAFAECYRANPASAPASCWAYVISSLSQDDGCPCSSQCHQAPLDYRYGGGHGFNGCGCNFTQTYDVTQTRANSHLSETWIQVRTDSRDGRGNAFGASVFVCNYDWPTYPWSI
jgi:hypothetical protein